MTQNGHIWKNTMGCESDEWCDYWGKEWRCSGCGLENSKSSTSGPPSPTGPGFDDLCPTAIVQETMDR